MYKLHVRDRQNLLRHRSVTSAEIRSHLDPSNSQHAILIRDIDDLESKGMRYSGQDGDVLSSAYSAAGRFDLSHLPTW